MGNMGIEVTEKPVIFDELASKTLNNKRENLTDAKPFNSSIKEVEPNSPLEKLVKNVYEHQQVHPFNIIEEVPLEKTHTV